MLTVQPPSPPPSWSMTLVLLPQIMGSRPECASCNGDKEKSIHPCRECMPKPACLSRAKWSPTYCFYCIDVTIRFINNPESRDCWVFEKMLRYYKKRSYDVDPFAKPLDMMAFHCILKPCATHLIQLGENSLWEKPFLLKVCKAARLSIKPYEAFKIANNYFASGQQKLVQDHLIEMVNQCAFPSPPAQKTKKLKEPKSTAPPATTGSRQLAQPTPNANYAVESTILQPSPPLNRDFPVTSGQVQLNQSASYPPTQSTSTIQTDKPELAGRMERLFGSSHSPEKNARTDNVSDNDSSDDTHSNRNEASYFNDESSSEFDNEEDSDSKEEVPEDTRSSVENEDTENLYPERVNNYVPGSPPSFRANRVSLAPFPIQIHLIIIIINLETMKIAHP